MDEIQAVERDIEITQKEIEAYNHLKEGYFILSGLEDAVEGQRRLYYYEYIKYGEYASEASVFLGQLIELKERLENPKTLKTPLTSK